MSGDIKAIETTTFQNETWKTFRPSSGAGYMSDKEVVESQESEIPDGFEVFHWPEFQALIKRLGVVTDQPIKSVTIRAAIGEIVGITVETVGRDTTKER